MKLIYKVDLVLIVGSLIALIFVVGYVQPLVIAPLDDYETSDTGILFSIENADVLLIDDNVEFSSPDEYLIEDGMRIDLVPGVYYWKAVGVFGSNVRTLTINSEVSLELRKIGDGYGVVNVGNVRLNVDVYKGSELVDKVRVGVGDVVEADGDKFVGEAE